MILRLRAHGRKLYTGLSRAQPCLATKLPSHLPSIIRPCSFTSCIPPRPTWSTKSLISGPPPDPITSSELHHLLRLSALPLPPTAADEERLVSNLQRQVCFVQRIQACDTAGVTPLVALRDETEAAIREATVGCEDVNETLDSEIRVGFFPRPRRIRDGPVDTRGAEDWDALSTASENAGRYMVVRSRRDTGE
jgi:Asp-tRNA(Asn)/Glu-tRNA(Gln) amidotransferase C subunit